VREPLYFVVVDLHASKDTLKILDRLNRCYPNADSAAARGVQDLFGPINQRIVHAAAAALRDGDAPRLGALLDKAQALFDQYAAPVCPEELTAPVLHRVLAHDPLKPHIWGGKGVGSQGDGTAQLLCRSAADREAVLRIVEHDLGLTGLPLTIAPQPRVRRAVIPAAGHGTRLFPATKAVKKELFPVVDRDGIAKPAILLIVEEALAAGIEEVVIVVQAGDLDDFRAFFSEAVSADNHRKLPPHLQAYCHRLLEIGRHVRYVIQTEQAGFGHAVYCARGAVGDEPFLLLLGDHLYRSNTEVSCARQLLRAYERLGQNIVGARRSPEADLAHFGALAGVWREEGRLLDVTAFAEKPTADHARAHLRVAGLPDGEYLTVFGQYVLTPAVFAYLEADVADNVRAGGEIQLTPVLDRIRRELGFAGLVIDGQRFDIGRPDDYLAALRALRR
jgi:UTP-glucose-1-phosphate uridylyltransferase